MHVMDMSEYQSSCTSSRLRIANRVSLVVAVDGLPPSESPAKAEVARKMNQEGQSDGR